MLPDGVAPEAHGNDHSYIREVSDSTNCELSSH